MPVTWGHENNEIVLFRVTGKLGKEELDIAQREAETVLQQGDARILVLAEDFEGWQKGGNWADLSFAERNDTFIHKMAIVADEKWRDQAAMFTMQGLRPFPIEFFTSETEARQWLDG